MKNKITAESPAAPYVAMSIPGWREQAAAAITTGQTEAEFVAHCHPDNRTNARNAFRMETAQVAAEKSAARYDVFTREWWREAEKTDGRWPNSLVPYPGAPKTYLARDVTESEAREICREWNQENPPGRLSRKAEYTES